MCQLLGWVPGPVAQLVGHLTRSQGSWVRYPVWQHTVVSPSAFSRRSVVSYWQKYVHEVLINGLGGLSLTRKSVVRLAFRPDMTLDVYRGRKTTIQQKLGWGRGERVSGLARLSTQSQPWELTHCPLTLIFGRLILYTSNLQYPCLNLWHQTSRSPRSF